MGTVKFNARKIVKIIVIVIIVIALIIIVLSEIDRCRPRQIRSSMKMYYESLQWITAPFNVFTNCNVKRSIGESRQRQKNTNRIDHLIPEHRSNLTGRLEYIREIQNTHPAYKTLSDEQLPFPDMETNFPDHVILQENWKKIRNEVLTIYDQGEMKKIKDDQFFRNIADNKWKRFYIKWYADILPEAYEKLPFTTTLLDKIPSLRSAMISVLEPGSVITRHVGPFRSIVRYHLALKTAETEKEREKCKIKMDGIEYSWKEGEDILFDDTYVHEVRNDSNELRIVLFCDIQRDLKSDHSNKLGDFGCKVAAVTTRNNNR